jgi:hypothetical protein
LPKHVTIGAGSIDRDQAIVSFPLTGAANGSYTLTDEAGGQHVACTVDGGQAWAVIDHLKAGQSRRFLIEPAADATPSVLLTKKGGAFEFTAAGAPILTYQSEKTPLPPGVDPVYQRGGYISPAFTPKGVQLTDDYPSNHKHHHGIWSPWTKTEYEGRHPDFWNMQDKTGRVDPAGVSDSWSGAACAGVRANHKFIDMTAKPEKVALNEHWDLVVYPPMKSPETCYAYDLKITQNVVDSPLILPKYRYGGLGFRGRSDWNGKGDACLMITSEGKTRANGDQTPARWVWVGGKTSAGEACGIAILCHPDNFRAPQPIRLHPDMPYVSYTPSALGDWKIEPGKPYVARYRFIAADGPLDRAAVERAWKDYAEPAKVTVE